jgi:site-specific DNA recombinase
MADLRTDAIRPGDVLILWESSRGSREQAEWATLLNLLRDKDVRVHVTSHGRTYDLSNPRDRRSLDEDGVDSAYESGKVSVRVTRAAAVNAVAGRPYGQIPFGYQRFYDPKTGKLAGQELDPERAPVIAELFDRIERGHSLRSIAIDFKERGIVNKSGKAISQEQLRDYALMAAYAGLRVHRPVNGDPGGTYEATWPQIVSPRQYYAVQKILSDPSRVTTRPGRSKWFLSMIAKCHVCTSVLAVAYPKKTTVPQYRCHAHGHVLIPMQELDEIGERAILGYLSRRDVLAKLKAAWGREDERLASIQDQLATQRARLDELSEAMAEGTITMQLGAETGARIQKKIDDLKVTEQQLSVPAELRGLVGDGEVRRNWPGKPMSARRAVARMLLSVGFLGELRVDRPSAAERIVLWTGDDQ